MSERSKAVDAYIAKAQPFARPILTHLRAIVHAACPRVRETIKWGMPFFEHEGNLCNMAAFKRHAAFGFWKHGQLVKSGAPLAAGSSRDAMGSFGRITAVGDLPPKRVLVALIKAAAKLNEAGTPSPMAGRRRKPAPRTPAYLLAALRRAPKVLAQWRAFPPGHRREYLEWIAEAKTPATRAKRIATMLEWVGEGRARNWQYAATRAKR